MILIIKVQYSSIIRVWLIMITIWVNRYNNHIEVIQRPHHNIVHLYWRDMRLLLREMRKRMNQIHLCLKREWVMIIHLLISLSIINHKYKEIIYLSSKKAIYRIGLISSSKMDLSNNNYQLLVYLKRVFRLIIKVLKKKNKYYKQRLNRNYLI